MPRGRRNVNLNLLYNALQRGKKFSKLYLAAHNENFRTVRAMIQSGTDVNRKDSAGNSTPIFGAVMSKNVQMVQELIRAGADVNVKASLEGVTPLIMGIVTQKSEIVKVLLESGADVHSRMYDGESALHFAVRLGLLEISQLLIEHGCEIDIRNEGDETPLHTAVITGRLEIVRLLLAKGADICATCASSNKDEDPENEEVEVATNVTPLFLAIYWGHFDIVDVLMEAGADVNVKSAENHTPLLIAVDGSQLELVNTLLKAGAKNSVNVGSTPSGYTPLFIAARNGSVDIIQALLKVEGIDLNPKMETKVTPLAVAALAGHFEVVKLLVAKGALVDSRAFNMATPLLMALSEKKDDIAKFLIAQGADVHAVDSKNTSSLHIACNKGVSLDIIKTLLEKGVHVNARTDDGRTPLHLAAQDDHVEIVKFLVSHGADSNMADNQNGTALLYAATKNSIRTVEYLATISENIAMSTTGMTPLHCAVAQGHREVVKILLKSGASVTALDICKHTPLHTAAEEGHLEIAELLLKHHAPVNPRPGKLGTTPLHLAIEHQHVKLVHLLLEKGAKVNAEDYGIWPIHIAVNTGSVEIVKALLSKGAYYNVEACVDVSGTPSDLAQKAGNAKLFTVLELVRKLFSAAIKNNTDQIKLCVEAGAIVNARALSGRTALHYAMSENNIDAVKVLLTRDADITLATKKGNLPLQIAVTNNFFDNVKILLAHARNRSFIYYNSVVNARTKRTGDTVLHTAVENNKFHLVKFLLENGAVYNAENNSGKTPLELSTTDETIKCLLTSTEKLFEVVKKEDGSEEAMQILKIHISALNAREGKSGGTPLHWSILKGHTDIARALLSSGADYCLVTKEGATPLHTAASEGNIAIVKELINRIKTDLPRKANKLLNAVTTSGTVALHVTSNLEIIKCLLQAGAIYDIRNGKDKMASELTRCDDAKRLLKMTHQMFDDVRTGVASAVDTLKSLESEEFKAVTSTRNTQGETLVQVALTNGRREIASQLLKRLKGSG